MPVVVTNDKNNRLAFKEQLLNKVEASLTPPVPETDPEPVQIEIIERYATGRPIQLELEPMEELLPEFKKEALYVPVREVEKRAEIKQGLLNKIEQALIPPSFEPDPEPAPIEIVQQYAYGLPQTVGGLPEQLDPERKKILPHILDSDVPKRAAAKSRLLNKVEESLIPPVNEAEPAPIEIIEKYARGIPHQVDDPIEQMLPEAKNPAPRFILDSDIPKRTEAKNRLLHKVEESLILPVIEEVEPAPIEIVENYAYGIPQQGMGIQDLLEPEAKKILPHIPDREVSKRAEIKRSLLNKIEEALIPPSFEEVEPVPIEIIDRYAHGIPNQLTDPTEQMLPEVKSSSKFILDSDVPKRAETKDRLLNKIKSVRVEDPEIKPVEIVGYSQRVVTPFEPEFGEIDRPSVVISDVEPEVLSVEVKEPEVMIPVLRLPENYQEFDERALYGILIRNPALQHTSDSANLVLDVLSGRSGRQVEFELINNVPLPERVIEVEPPASKPEIQDQFKPQDAEKRAAFLSGLVDKVEKLFDSQAGEEEYVAKPELMLQLPEDWNTIPLSTLRADLLNSGGTPEQVDELLAYLVEKPEKVETQLAVTMAEEVLVEVPESFNTWKPSDQYVYLTRVLKLTPEKANEVMYNEV